MPHRDPAPLPELLPLFALLPALGVASNVLSLVRTLPTGATDVVQILCLALGPPVLAFATTALVFRYVTAKPLRGAAALALACLFALGVRVLDTLIVQANFDPEHRAYLSPLGFTADKTAARLLASVSLVPVMYFVLGALGARKSGATKALSLIYAIGTCVATLYLLSRTTGYAIDVEGTLLGFGLALGALGLAATFGTAPVSMSKQVP